MASGSNAPANHALTEADGFGPSGVVEHSVVDIPWKGFGIQTGSSCFWHGHVDEGSACSVIANRAECQSLWSRLFEFVHRSAGQV